MVAIALIFGELTAESYSDHFAKDPRIDALRDKMQTQEDKKFSADYLNPDKRAIANAIQIYFSDGTHTDKITVEYPLGHPRRRDEGIPLLIEKFVNNLQEIFTPAEIDARTAIFLDQEKLENMPVNEFMELFISHPHSA
jgi:2-methylcitrate dehydratase